MSDNIIIEPVTTKAQKKTFVDLAFRINANDPHWVPPLKSEIFALLDPKKNPFFEHGKVQLFLALRGNKPVGRISAHFDELALAQPVGQGFGPGTGNWGMLEAVDQLAATALITAAEAWLKTQNMSRVVAPLSLSVWDEPGLQTKGFDHAPTVMMGHNKAEYGSWVEASGYTPVKSLYCYDLDIRNEFEPIIQRIIKSGERNDRITIRKVDKSQFARDAAIILGLLNDAWSENWGFVPLTDSEIDHVGKKLKPIVFEDLIRIAELDGEAVAFMMTLPDLNEATRTLNGSLLPFGWAKILWWLRKPKVRTMRVPLMGVKKELQNTRMASQLAFMMIEYIRRAAVSEYHSTRGEIGWILEDNQGMKAIADALNTKINREYTLYEKAL